MSNTINIDKMATAIASALADYQSVALDVVEKAVTETAKETASEVKNNALSAFGGTGEYAKSWTAGQKKKSNSNFAMTVYSKAPHYRLTHLLENGHALVNGGRYEGVKHIKPAEDKAEDKLMQRLKNSL